MGRVHISYRRTPYILPFFPIIPTTHIPSLPTVFQAHKFMIDRPDLVTHIRQLRTPRDALGEAGRLRRLQRSDWFDVNVGIMDDILYAKFTQHPELEEALLGTGNRKLVEDSRVRTDYGHMCEVYVDGA